MKRKVVWILRLLLGGLFLYSGALKVWDVAAFAQAVHGYRLLPDAVVPVVAQVLPWLEIWCALALWFTPILRRASWIWINLLLVVFTVAKISALQRGLDISCGCTHSATPMTWMSVVENFFLLALSLPGLCLDED